MTNLEALIERWRAADERAAEAIYNLHRDRTFRLAYGLLGNTEDAEEAAQDALAYALLNIHHFDEKRSKFTTWLHMITVSRSRDVLRKRRLPTFSLTAWLKDLPRDLRNRWLPHENGSIPCSAGSPEISQNPDRSQFATNR